MRKMRNSAQLIFVDGKMRKFSPTRKPVALEALVYTSRCTICSEFLPIGVKACIFHVCI